MLFQYGDMDTLQAEIDEFFSYTEVEQFYKYQENFHKEYDGGKTSLEAKPS